MLISHEVPISYLEESQAFNDYDYCLVHLCDQYPEYLEYYKSRRRYNREVLLDNSIFELGTSYAPDKFAERIFEIQPTYYVVPDALEDAATTMSNWEEFTSHYGSLKAMRIGVVQGKSVQEIIECYKFMSDRADYIAISFDYSLYDIIGDGDSKLKRQATGRPRLLQVLMELGIWNCRKPHHLLGCSLASEFAVYRNVREIRSVDTSNPIVAALNNTSYIKGIGLRNKSPIKLADLIDVDYDDEVFELMEYNAAEFKKLTH